MIPNLTKQLTCAAIAFCILAGCANNNNKTADMKTLDAQQQNTAQQVPPELRLADHKAWINRLLATPPVDQGIRQVSAVAGNGMTVPIPTPSTFGRYMLQVDQQNQLVWLMGNGQQNGPWKLDNPDVVHILNSLRNPPTGMTAQSQAPQMQ